ncbi:hypothetical protein GIY23_19930 [Allosaccharopolyspora coralli]|uniref:Uncharacterized protein n=1 Tax=Allosaccharopolyspora coralli TaxID=2665642 RepID=A0A5Q3QKW3_9PSEU|nr:hypothetical protein [Allosaccharopolyspora coralli]QGK71477.1 hypothetical protein GIY23_19930 [Allosaccharopolyspora coralli]
MSGIEADPQVLHTIAAGLRGAGDDLDASAAPPPVPQAGEVSEFVSATLQMLCEGVGNVAASATGLGEAVAAGKTEYETRDYEEALNLKRAELNRGN